MFGAELGFLKFLEGLRTDSLTAFFEGVTMLGEETLMVLILAILWFAYDKVFAQKIFYVTITSLGVNGVIKNIAKVPRPFASGEITAVRQETATGYSFPSGHTQTFTTWSSVLALKLKKRWFSILTAVLILLVACSRMFLGVHYPSDVITGAVLGIAFAYAGGKLFDRVKDKHKLYWITIALFAPFLIVFFLQAEPLYADFFKLYGMLLGLPFAVRLEEKYAPLRYDVIWWKKALRVVIGVALALAVKEAIKLIDVFGILQITLILHVIRYIALIVIVLGLCPVLFKKYNF